jgi:hypothetical protein
MEPDESSYSVSSEGQKTVHSGCVFLIGVFLLVFLNVLVGAALYYANQCLPASNDGWGSYKIERCVVFALSGEELSEVRSYEELLEKGVWRGIYGADIASFSELGNGYARDKTTVYFEGLAFSAADPATFSHLMGLYSIDGDHVFWRNKPIAEASLDEFEIFPTLPDLAASGDQLYYRGRPIERSLNNTELRVVSPAELQPVSPGETIELKWSAGLYFEYVLLQLVNSKGSVYWLSEQPLKNTGSYVLTVPHDTALEGAYSIRLIGLSESKQLASYAVHQDALLVENAHVELFVNDASPNVSPVYAALDEDITVSWQTENAGGCKLIEPKVTKTISSERGMIHTNVSDYTSQPSIINVLIDCQTKTGRPIGDVVTIVIGEAVDKSSYLQEVADNEVAVSLNEVRLLRELAPYLYTDESYVYYDAGAGALRPHPMLQPGTLTVLADRFILASEGVWYRYCSPGGSCYLLNIPGADPETFEIINKYYIKDKDTVYLVLSASDREHDERFLPVREADPVTFEVLGNLFARDKTQVFYADAPIIGALPESFAPYPLSLGFSNASMFKDEAGLFIFQEAHPDHELTELRARPVSVGLRDSGQ